MTCREFKHQAEALTLWELAQGQDGRILEHVQQCESCGSWLQEQRKLAASLQTLQAQTAAREASPKVERAVLQAFRRRVAESGAFAGAARNAAVFAGDEERTAKSELPLALRLSRWFEVGAYVAVAAAIVVGMFLGIRLLQRSSRPVAVQSQTSPESAKPLGQQSAPPVRAAFARGGVEKPVAAAPEVIAKADSAPLSQPRKAAARKRLAHAQPARSGNNEIAAASLATEEPQSDTDAGYVPLMFCDPLSCASGSQVVRMELPAGPSSQPQAADVVVGYDGVVRAVRIVN